MTLFPIFINPDYFHRARPLEREYVAPDCNGRRDAIDVLKSSGALSANTKAVLDDALILGIIAAEQERMSLAERIFDVNGLGPGQLYKDAHTDVLNNFSKELQDFVSRVSSCLTSQGKGTLSLQSSWQDNVKNDKLANFVAAYLALTVERSQKAGRSREDALHYGIALYHGARATVVGRLSALSRRPNSDKGEIIPWADVAKYMRDSGDAAMLDLLDYISTVLRPPPKTTVEPQSGSVLLSGARP